MIQEDIPVARSAEVLYALYREAILEYRNKMSEKSFLVEDEVPDHWLAPDRRRARPVSAPY